MATIKYQYRLVSTGVAPGETRLEIVKTDGEGTCGVDIAYQNTGLLTPHAGNTLQRNPSSDDVFLDDAEPSRCVCITPRETTVLPEFCVDDTDPFADDSPIYAETNWPKDLFVKFSDVEETDDEFPPPADDNNCWMDFDPSFVDFLTNTTFILRGHNTRKIDGAPEVWHWRTEGDYVALWDDAKPPNEQEPFVASDVYSIAEDLCPPANWDDMITPNTNRTRVQYAMRMTIWPCRDDISDPDPTETRRGQIILDLLKIVSGDSGGTREEAWYPFPSAWLYKTGGSPIDLSQLRTIPLGGPVSVFSTSNEMYATLSKIRIGQMTIGSVS